MSLPFAPSAVEAPAVRRSMEISRQAFEQAKRVIPGGSMRQASWFAPHPPYAVRGAGCWIEDLDGGKLLDLANNFFSLVHGHSFAPVVAAIRETAANGTAFGLPTQLETALAEAIRARSPRCEQVRFCNSGSEAVMVAIKGARGITGRPAIAKFEGAYHGCYDYVEVSLGANPSNWDTNSGDPAVVPYAAGTPRNVLADTVILPFADPDRCAAILAREAPRLAAILLDTLPSKGGMVPVGADTLAVLKEACQRHGILLICDEVIGFRLSHAGAHLLFGLEPDFVTLGKIIGGGLPVGAVAGPAQRMAVFDHTQGAPIVAHGGTFSANPLTMAAGLAALSAYDAAAVERLNHFGGLLRSLLNSVFAAKGLPAQATGAGSMFQVHFTSNKIFDNRSSYPSDRAKKAQKEVHLAMLARGFLLTPNCSGALSTPMTESDIKAFASAMADAVVAQFAAEAWQ